MLSKTNRIQKPIITSSSCQCHPIPFHNILSIRPITLQFAVPRIISKLALVDRVQRRATQPIRRLIDRRPQLIYRAAHIAVQPRQNIRCLLQTRLEPETDCIVALQEILRVEHTAREHGRVEASECVGRARVAAHGKELRVLERHDIRVYRQIRNRIVINQVSLVPVIRDLLLAYIVLEVGISARDTIEALECLAVEQALGVLGGFVAHEAINEGPGGGGSDYAGEGRIEEVGILGDGFLETSGAVVGEDTEVDGVAVGLAEFVEVGELGELEFVVIPTVHMLGLDFIW